MNLDDCIIICFCLLDEILLAATKGERLRHRGPMPKLAESEVMTMELVGTYLGLSQDQEVFDDFRRHYTKFFPRLAHVTRTTLAAASCQLVGCERTAGVSHPRHASVLSDPP